LESWSESLENKEKLLKAQDTQSLVLNESLSQKAKEAGNDYLRAKDYDQAFESYSKSIELNPRNSQAYFNRALVLLKQFKYKKAAEDCDKAIFINPKYFKAFHRRALALMELKEWEKAVEDWKVVLENDPENEEANEKLKKCRDELSTITGYRRIQITEVEDDDEENKENEEINLAEQNPDVQEIEKDPALQSIIALQSQEEFIKELEMIKSQGNSSFRKEDYDQAITFFTKSIFAIEKRFSEEKIVINPPILSLVIAFYNNRALAYSKLDLNLEAINDSKKVLRFDQNNSKALFRIGKCQSLRNNLQAAHESFSHLLSIEPNNELAKKELEEIKSKQLLVTRETLVTSPRNRSSFRKCEGETEKSYERRVSFREEDLSVIEHKDSLKDKDKFKKAEAAFPKKINSDDEDESSDHEERKTKKEVISKETIKNAKEIASKLVVLDAPKTALMFESAAKSLKSDPESFYEYIHVLNN
jgi:tetratricopeptide (TPR) repeat protein